jgi:AcrR family transcriptional regulator
MNALYVKKIRINGRQQERLKRREAILEAAACVFGRKPFDESTMQDVAAEAQIGMQSLYEHFPSKQKLYEEVITLRSEVFHDRANSILAGLEDPLEQILALSMVYVRQFKDRPIFLPMFIRDRVYFDWGFDSRFSPRFQEIYQIERARLKAIFEKAVSKGQIRPFDSEFLAQIWMDVLQASLHYSHRFQPNEEVETCVERAVECLLKGLGRN